MTGRARGGFARSLFFHPPFPIMSAPLGGRARMPITANQVSFARIVLLPIPVYLLYRGPAGQWAAVVLFVFLGITDYVDGYLARRYGSTEFGKFLDPISDKIYMAAMFLPLVHLGVFAFWPVLLVFVREFLVTDLRTIYNRTGASFTTSTMGKYKTNVQVFGVVIALMNGLLYGTLGMPLIVAGIVIPLFFLAVFRYARTGRIHPYILLFLVLFPPLLVAETELSVAGVNLFVALVILFFTLYSGAEYFLGGWTQFRRYIAEAPRRRTLLFLAQGVLVPAVFCALMARGVRPVWAPVVIVALEFVCGGLDNFLTMHGKVFSYRWKVAELVGMVGPALAALVFYRPSLDGLLYFSVAVTIAYATVYVFIHRADLAIGSRPTPAA